MNLPSAFFQNLHCLCFLLFSLLACAQPEAPSTDSEPGLFGMDQLDYLGAFRLPSAEFGVSSLNYSEGPIVYNPRRHSLFMVGHSHQQAIAEFLIPALVKSEIVTELNIAPTPLQNFSLVLDRSDSPNRQNIDRVGGLAFFHGEYGTELFVNAYEYYDAEADNVDSSLILRNADNLAETKVDGFFQFQAPAGHSAGWLSPIPVEWQTVLGGSYITGHSGGIPIISRSSVGPSAFAFDPFEVIGTQKNTGSIATTQLLDFSLEHPLNDDLENINLDNDLWTHLSRVTYGFIVPGSRSYLTIGYSGGHKRGVCYKCEHINDPDNTCSGYCAKDAQDQSSYFWLWDIADFIKVKRNY